MGLSCGMKCVKALFFVFNFIFFVLGIAVLGVGIYSRVENDSFDSFFEGGVIVTAANLLIAAGVIVALIGFMGCCGAIKQSKVLLGLYAALVILIFILEIVGGALAYTKRDAVEATVTKQIAKSLDEYGNTDLAAKGLAKTIDLFQEKIKCCGSNGPNDWASTDYIQKLGNNSDVAVPKSCCKTSDDDCNTRTKKGYYTLGCIAQGKTYIKDNLWLVGGVGVGIAVVQLLGIVFAISLICAIKEEEKGTSA